MTASEDQLSKPPCADDCSASVSCVQLVAPPTIYRDCLAHMLCAYGVRTTVSERIECSLERPDVLLLDVTRGYVLPASLRDDLERFQAAADPAPIVIIADLREQFDAIRGQIDRVVACIPSSLTVRGTLSALRFACDGGRFAPLRFMDSIHEMRGAASDSEALDCASLTPREQQIIHLLRCGKANKAIAHELAISLSTVKVHVHNIMKKSNSRNRTEVALLKSDLNGHQPAA